MASSRVEERVGREGGREGARRENARAQIAILAIVKYGRLVLSEERGYGSP